MTREDIHRMLTVIFRQVFDDPVLEISDATTAQDVANWDSLTHIHLIVAVEKAFRISFTTKQVKALSNVGDLIRAIASRTH